MSQHTGAFDRGFSAVIAEYNMQPEVFTLTEDWALRADQLCKGRTVNSGASIAEHGLAITVGDRSDGYDACITYGNARSIAERGVAYSLDRDSPRSGHQLPNLV